MATEFLDNLRSYSFTPRTRSVLGFDLSRSGRTSQELRRSGLFWVHPLFATSTDSLEVGVRLTPGIPSLLDMPLVIINRDRVGTLASTLRSGLALTMVELSIGPNAGNNWSLLNSKRKEAEPELVGFEKLLGGDSVPRLFDVLNDTELHTGLRGEGSERKEAVVTLYERLDPEQGAVRRWIHEGAAIDAPTYPSWRQVVATANFKRALKRREGFDPVKTAWQLFAGPVALDASNTGLVRQPEPLRWTFGRWTALHAARALRDAEGSATEELRSDPLWPAVMSLAEKAEACDGLAFVEAAAHLEESGQPERALAALAAASYLSSQALGQALTPIAEAAAFTASRQGWSLLESLFVRAD